MSDLTTEATVRSSMRRTVSREGSRGAPARRPAVLRRTVATNNEAKLPAIDLSKASFRSALRFFLADPQAALQIWGTLGVSRVAYQAVYGKQGGDRFAQDLGNVVHDSRTRAREIVFLLGSIVGGLAAVVWVVMRF